MLFPIGQWKADCPGLTQPLGPGPSLNCTLCKSSECTAWVNLAPQLGEFFLQENPFPQGLVPSTLVVGWAWGWAAAVVIQRGHAQPSGAASGQQSCQTPRFLSPSCCLLLSSVSEELKGEGEGRGAYQMMSLGCGARATLQR